jgi:methylphosphotriester-DNA--protein-cysteine methyltransferase
MIAHINISDKELWRAIHQQIICFAGNNKLKIYGKLGCSSGKRMKKENRIFFQSEKEALDQGFRPCGHCMKDAYKKWKHELIR